MQNNGGRLNISTSIYTLILILHMPVRVVLATGTIVDKEIQKQNSRHRFRSTHQSQIFVAHILSFSALLAKVSQQSAPLFVTCPVSNSINRIKLTDSLEKLLVSISLW
jgi:adenosyl cobinamide kinase/adenosyl cobinamide phosphate guanylyltransferase